MIDSVLSRKSVWEKLAESEKPIVIYGMGNGADRVIDELERLGIGVAGVFASDEFVRGQSFRGHKVKTLLQLENELSEFNVAVAFATCIDEVIDRILAISKRHGTLVPCVPVCGSEIFSRAFVSENSQQLEAAYSLLCDEKSRRVFEGCVSFMFGGELPDLLDITTDKDEMLNGLFELSENEDYLDLGAYRGDTVDEFLACVKGKYSSITAVEPDRKSFAKLEKHLEKITNSTAIRMGISDKCSTALFNSAAGRQSSYSERGELIETVSVDALCAGRRVTYLKADIEGAERQMLEGARQTLSEQKPKLSIAAYHRSEDIFRLPLLIHEINPQYRIFIRRHKYIPCWDMNYYCL